ncbi:MAG: hypothetical protein U0359_21880 [Byssovorax sp.]
MIDTKERRMTRGRRAMLGVLALGLGTMGMAAGACGSSEPGAPGSCPAPPEPPDEEVTTCPAAAKEPCLRYHIPLVGNPSMDVALRSKYVKAFGAACYMSEFDTFDCFYKKWQDACADAAKIGEVSGSAAYDQGYTCQPVAGTDDYTLQIGADVANYITINYQAAPRETPLIEIGGVPTEVSGPYRDLTEPAKLGVGEAFYCPSGQVDANGESLNQREWILQVNRKAHGGKLYSDLAGFKYECGRDDNCNPKICTEPGELKATPKDDPEAAQVHHVVRRKDQRGCFWGTNSNKNAAVISRKLNGHLTNSYPSEEEVTRINALPSAAP